jgi:hypothetical protein
MRMCAVEAQGCAIPYGTDDPFLTTERYVAPNAYLYAGTTFLSNQNTVLNTNKAYLTTQLTAANIQPGANCEVKLNDNWYRGTFQASTQAEEQRAFSDGAGGTAYGYYSAGTANNPYYYVRPYKCVVANGPQPTGNYEMQVHILPTGGMWCQNAADTDCNGVLSRSEVVGYLLVYINGQATRVQFEDILQAWIVGGTQ